MARPAFLDETAHRPYPPPDHAWVLRQTWYHLLFAHWRVDPELLRTLLPPPLVPDVRDGAAWIGVVPFGMTDVAPRGIPAVPGLSRFLELNVRTYVTLDDRPGAYFFSLDAANRIAVELARASFRLPYFKATMRLELDGADVRYSSQRTDRRAPPARLEAVYRPTGPVFHAARGSLESFLTDRYCLYTARAGRASRAEIHHAPWPLQRASAEIAENRMASAAGVELPREAPHLLYAREIRMVAWLPRACGTARA